MDIKRNYLDNPENCPYWTNPCRVDEKMDMRCGFSLRILGQLILQCMHGVGSDCILPMHGMDSYFVLPYSLDINQHVMVLLC